MKIGPLVIGRGSVVGERVKIRNAIVFGRDNLLEESVDEERKGQLHNRQQGDAQVGPGMASTYLSTRRSCKLAFSRMAARPPRREPPRFCGGVKGSLWTVADDD